MTNKQGKKGDLLKIKDLSEVVAFILSRKDQFANELVRTYHPKQKGKK